MNIAFIPLRCGSKSIPLKNIKNFCGKPLVYWSLIELEKSQVIDKVYVATDCDEVISIVNSFKFLKVFIYKRDPENAKDDSSTESVILEFLKTNNFKSNDYFFLVQATSPFTSSHDFDKAFNLLKLKEGDSLLTCVRVKRFFWNENGVPMNYDYKIRPRRQDFNGDLMENGAFYINKIGNIIKGKNRLFGKIIIYEMDENTSVELDEQNDWLIAEQIMYKIKSNNNNLNKVKLFLSDVDGTLTDSGMYYGENGEVFKKFNTRDGKGFELLRKSGIKTGIITSEDSKIVKSRAKKLKIDYLFQGKENSGKLNAALSICEELSISLKEVAYIGDDINCYELLKNVGWAACPADSNSLIKNLPNITKLTTKGGSGAVREFIELILYNK